MINLDAYTILERHSGLSIQHSSKFVISDLADIRTNLKVNVLSSPWVEEAAFRRDPF